MLWAIVGAVALPEPRDLREAGTEECPPDGRSRYIVATMQRAWQAYASSALGSDTLQPLTRTGVDDFGGMATSAVDALDTLWLLGLKEEFRQAAAAVAASEYTGTVNVFETTIRVLGGLLSAHLLSGEAWLLERAVRLGEQLSHAFAEDTLPRSDLNLGTLRASNPAWGRSVSEVALTLEFKELASLSGNPRFAELVDASDALLREQVASRPTSLLPPTFKLEREWSGKARFAWSGGLRLGGRVDSYYEYLLKEYVRSGDVRYRDAFVHAAHDMRRLYVNHTDFLFVGEEHAALMDHLVCFWPGTLALAVREGVLPAEPFLGEAHRILQACLRMHVPPHSLAPEITSLSAQGDLFAKPADRHNLLRPETLESLYLMWLQTRDPWYCEWSWHLFRSLERAARVEHGYASIEDVTSAELRHRNAMPSYFLAETLKYAWLCSEKGELDGYVLTTEAHLVRREGGQTPREGAA